MQLIQNQLLPACVFHTRGQDRSRARCVLTPGVKICEKLFPTCEKLPRAAGLDGLDWLGWLGWPGWMGWLGWRLRL